MEELAALHALIVLLKNEGADGCSTDFRRSPLDLLRDNNPEGYADSSDERRDAA